jgi:hypothetical protein
MTTSGLSRLELRAGRVDDAIAMLTDALAEFTALGATSYVLDTHVRRVECLLYARQPDAAIELATAVERDVADAAVPVLPLTLARFHGVALLQRGDRAAAIAKLRVAVAEARRCGVDYEVARSLQVMVAAGSTHVDRNEIAEILRRLGVVGSPPLPG